MSESKKFGLLGKPLGHSYSKLIHEDVFNKVGFDGEYQLFESEISKINEIVQQIRDGSLLGINITVPYKETILEYLDVVSHEVKAIGSCNTIMLHNKKICGYNTDYYGFKKTIERNNLNVNNKKVTILGAGGVCKAALVYLLEKDCEVTVVSNKGSQKLKDLKEKFPEIRDVYYEQIDQVVGNIIIQSTPVGMSPKHNECIVSREVIAKYQVAIDLIYNPTETLFLKYAKAEGIIAINGLDMLLDQAFQSEKIWNQIEVSKSLREEIYQNIKEQL